MAHKFYVAIRDKNVSVHVTWEECKDLRNKYGGIYVKGFNTSAEAIEWAASLGVALSEEDIPSYVVNCEPVL